LTLKPKINWDEVQERFKGRNISLEEIKQKFNKLSKTGRTPKT